MSRGTILHLFGWDKKFVLPFRDLIHEHFADGRHRFVVYGDVEEEALPPSPDTVMYPSLLKNVFTLSKALHQAEKVILHGLFSNHLLYLLALQPWLLKKCYWVMWGGDFYVHEDEKRDWRWRKNEFFRGAVIKRMGHFVTYIKGDYELARRWYGADGEYHECLMYPSNLYKKYAVPPKSATKINILVGNSAALTNNHLEAFEKLFPFKSDNVLIYCPLSYGPTVYAASIAKLGKEMFGDKFIPLLEFIPFEKYLGLLGQIDIAVFAHKRQQAMGNIITLLGLGKKIFMRDDIASWDFLNQMGIKIYSINGLQLGNLDEETKQSNVEKVRGYFSESNLLSQLGVLFK